VLLEDTLAFTVASHTIESTNPRTTIDGTLAIGMLPHAKGAAIPRLMTTAIVEVAVAFRSRCPTHAGKSSNLLLAVDLLAKDKE
jgi:hypothetical protein